jgi:myo-inositol-1(or 4)-monophosphatase
LARALTTAVHAAQAAGRLMRQHAGQPKIIHTATQHDIKLELDVRCQELIQRRLLKAFPEHGFFGEESQSSLPDTASRWVVDPIDGTVNFAYGVPHACVSIALECRLPALRSPDRRPKTAFQTMLGVVYDPFCQELWTAIRGQPAQLNGRPVTVSPRQRLDEAIVALGFGKRNTALGHLLPAFTRLTPRVRKLRLMGSAALALTYVATGRFDAYVEVGLGRWDFAAGGLIVECAGGQFRSRELRDGSHAVEATNAHLQRLIRRLIPTPRA